MLVSKCCESEVEFAGGDSSGIICRCCAKEVKPYELIETTYKVVDDVAGLEVGVDVGKRIGIIKKVIIGWIVAFIVITLVRNIFNF